MTAGDQPMSERHQLGMKAADATLTASRALLGVVARSVSPALEFVTLPHFRVLVVLTTAGPTRMGALAERMGANPSTFSRSIDRMVTWGWVERTTSPGSRREILIQVTPAGRALVDEVTERRRRGIADILARMTEEDQRLVVRALELFSDAASEPAVEDLLTLGL
jgi:DNA-binding MarR family transcriptional regulator